MTTVVMENKAEDLVSRDRQLKDQVRFLTRSVVDFGKGVEIRSGEDCKKASEFLAGPVTLLKGVINDTFDGPIEKAQKLRRLQLDLLRELQAGKMAWIGPALEVERSVRDKIETFILLKDLEHDKEVELVQSSGKLTTEVLWKRLAMVQEEYGKNHPDVDEILDLIDASERGELRSEEVPMGDASSPVIELHERVSSRDNWKWELTDIEKVKYHYLTTRDVPISKLVRKRKMLAEELVGGIRVYKEKGLIVRREKK